MSGKWLNWLPNLLMVLSYSAQVKNVHCSLGEADFQRLDGASLHDVTGQASVAPAMGGSIAEYP